MGYVSEQAAYHHGETSLVFRPSHRIIRSFLEKKKTRLATESETIVGMAQDFVGSNNINLWGNPPGILDGSGMFWLPG